MSRGPAVPTVPALSRGRALALVVSGGVVGTMARALIEAAYARTDSLLPWATFAINISGAALLGLLIQAVALREHRSFRARNLRLLLGTGLLGGYTTYSTFVLESVQIGSERHILNALVYDAATLTLGFLAAFVAMTLVRLVDRRRSASAERSR